MRSRTLSTRAMQCKCMTHWTFFIMGQQVAGSRFVAAFLLFLGLCGKEEGGEEGEGEGEGGG